jgi:hypothetical protein
MKSKLLIFLYGAVGFLAIAIPTLAHHGTAAYDTKNLITLKGIVTDFSFINPHTQIYIDVKDDNGGVINWGCELTSPARLARVGWTKDSLRPGDQIIVTVGPAKNGAHVGVIRTIAVNGKTLSPGLDEAPSY